jgi:hypothetical protein
VVRETGYHHARAVAASKAWLAEHPGEGIPHEELLAEFRFAAGLGRVAARIAALGLVMWNMRKIHFSHSCKTAVARMAVKGGRSPARRAASEAP